MPDLIIKAENISKKYRLGVLNSGSLKQDLNRYWQDMTRRDTNRADKETQVNELWALRDVNFSIRRGEVLGFVGRNGAGKSTLLKILSKVTAPTTGSIKGIGRIASMLDVGTGFHPELTGRENIFLNGHILGMKKHEIISRFDEIVAFSGVEKFIDTPVKRYSSGMYVRLAFAVASHMDPDILIVDEALAVGDTDFRAKCIRKMKSISADNGKTVLFVSHNMQAMRDLCKRIIYIDHGRIMDDGMPEAVIANYLNREKAHQMEQGYDTPGQAPGNEFIKIKRVAATPAFDKKTVDTATPLHISFEAWKYAALEGELTIGIHIADSSGAAVFDVHTAPQNFGQGIISGGFTMPAGFLNSGSYYISFDFIKNNAEQVWSYDTCISFDVLDNGEQNTYREWKGYVKPAFPVSLKFEAQ